MTRTLRKRGLTKEPKDQPSLKKKAFSRTAVLLVFRNLLAPNVVYNLRENEILEDLALIQKVKHWKTAFSTFKIGTPNLRQMGRKELIGSLCRQRTIVLSQPSI